MERTSDFLAETEEALHLSFYFVRRGGVYIGSVHEDGAMKK
jgi:hypothetical protein